MRRLLGAYLVVSVLAGCAGIGTARAQTPAPAAIPWDEAELSWPAPTEFAGGGSLASCASGPCGIMYVVEAVSPGGPGWGPLAITAETHYRATDLAPGLWQFRIRAFFKGSGYSAATPSVSKTIKAPNASPPGTPTVQ